MTSLLWKLLRPAWKPAPTPRLSGYTALLPVPADLPVFLRVALGTLQSQTGDELTETLVIPDRPAPEFTRAFDAARQDWHRGPIRLVTLPTLDRLITRCIHSPHIYHWLQMVSGVESATTSHVLLHDADLFILDRDFLSGQFRRISQATCDALGVQGVWDPWYAEHRLGYVTATWELMFRVDWARSFKPWMHRGHHGVIHGAAHEFDTMLLPQCLTPPERIQRGGEAFRFVHFNYVICTYRWFQEHTRRHRTPYVDEHFRILLIRLLVDAYQSIESEAQAPGLAELVQGLGASPGRVDYRADACARNYAEFREKLRQLIDSDALEDRQKQVLAEGIAPFDQAYLGCAARGVRA